mmetsp:Transcript_369/g.864  ORF Transcript_369/g.864 Transcript_369/m.864 type:complete len:440 (-) Transcript_369:1717-3036(-)
MDLVEQDITDLIAAHRYRLSLTPPKQSNFRVVALIFYELTSETDSESCNETTATTTCKSISTGSNKRRYVVGTNDEPCTISGSICAERAALLQLRFLPNVTQITKVVIVTDSPQPISPGMLCREYMSSHDKIDIDTMDIVLGSSVCGNCGLDVSIKDADAKLEGSCCAGTSEHQHHDFHRINTTLAELYPHPSPYVSLSAKEAEEVGSSYAAKAYYSSQADDERLDTILSAARYLSEAGSVEELDRDLHCGRYRDGKEDLSSKTPETRSGEVMLLLDDSDGTPQRKVCYLSRKDAAKYLVRLARDIAEKDSRSALHPLRYGAAVLYSDGTTSLAYQKKALEYGCSLDAVGQLAHDVEEKGREGQRPVMLVQADQFGIIHAPFAPGRAFLSEHGYGDCEVAIHTNTSDSLKEGEPAEILVVKASDLTPAAPDIFGESGAE